MRQSMEVAERNISKFLEGRKDFYDRSDTCARECSSSVQQILQEVGKASLDENGDWLLLHRARLIKPPIS
jgi:hypothetical protein